MITLDGITDTVAGWARRRDLPIGTLRGRLSRHWSETDAINTPAPGLNGAEPSNAILVEVDGTRLSLTGWARRNGLTLQTILDRLDRGWAPSRAVTEPTGTTKPGRKPGITHGRKAA